MLNPIWLHTFRTLVEVGHFTQTADKLHMTQPGVSQHIKKLEQACGHELFRRENKRFELTEQGRMLYAYAIEWEEQEAQLLEELNSDDPFLGTGKLACSGSLALRLYTPLLELQQQHRQLVIQLEAAPNQSILNGISQGKIDLGIVTDAPSKSQFHSEHIGQEALCLILPAGYQDIPLTPEVLKTCGVIGHPDAEHYMTLLFEQCNEPRLKELKVRDLPLSGFVNQLSQILLPVSKGLGWTVLPQSAVETFPLREQLYIVPLSQAVYEELYLVHQRNRSLPKRYTTIRERLIQTLGHG
ncbi:LysR family transcriptional regulator [Vibrio sp. CAU 1672]|uniref:LysR family transcriptional regulator n=1 Tax=Vibrio sp. CAU 1672 TaxID=3032594 RepID=UPI0023DC6978|nr:LysR family transcriptional regulator [Vibrio sp. CAU 1672]MDF2155796.1 LysR family transcriptional regulator [Vibrio sp. CAU 1672]